MRPLAVALLVLAAGCASLAAEAPGTDQRPEPPVPVASALPSAPVPAASASVDPNAPIAVTKNELGQFLLAAATAMLRSALGEPYDPAFECTPGDLVTPDNHASAWQGRSLELMDVTANFLAGIDASPSARRKIHAEALVFADGTFTWNYVTATRANFWGQYPQPLIEAPPVVERTLRAQLDPAQSYACRPTWDVTSPARYCDWRAPNPNWERRCVESHLQGQARSLESCANLDPPVTGEPLMLAVHGIVATFREPGHGYHWLEPLYIKVMKGRLCLHHAHFSI